MYTTKQAAQKLGIRQATIRQYIHKGYLKAHKKGRDWFLSSQEINKRLAKLKHDK